MASSPLLQRPSRLMRQMRWRLRSLDRPPAWQVAPNLHKSFQYATFGILYACRTQRNFRIHLLMTAVACGLGLCLHLPAVELVLVGLTCALVLALELVNTALEAVVDLTVGQSYHLLAKIAKDCAAGAVLVAALASLAVAALLLGPAAWALLG